VESAKWQIPTGQPGDPPPSSIAVASRGNLIHASWRAPEAPLTYGAEQSGCCLPQNGRFAHHKALPRSFSSRQRVKHAPIGSITPIG